MKTEEYVEGLSFRVDGVTFGRLRYSLSQIPGVVFTQKRRFFRLRNKDCEFKFREQLFKIEEETWNGDLYIMAQEGQKPPNEMQELRDEIEKFAFRGSWLERLLKQIRAEL